MTANITRENNITFRLYDGLPLRDSCIDSMCSMIASGVAEDEIETVKKALKDRVHKVSPSVFQGFYMDGEEASFVYKISPDDKIMSDIREQVLGAKL